MEFVWFPVNSLNVHVLHSILIHSFHTFIYIINTQTIYSAHLYWYCSINLHTEMPMPPKMLIHFERFCFSHHLESTDQLFRNTFFFLKNHRNQSYKFPSLKRYSFHSWNTFLYSISFIIFNIKKKEHQRLSVYFIKMVYLSFYMQTTSRPIIISWAFLMGMCTWSTLLFPLYHSLLF